MSPTPPPIDSVPNGLYLPTLAMRQQLADALRRWRFAAADDPLVVARDELSLWLDDLECGRATWLNGFLALQRAREALEGGSHDSDR